MEEIRQHVRDGEKMIAINKMCQVMRLPLKDAVKVLGILVGGG
jgi:hypothetical protein